MPNQTSHLDQCHRTGRVLDKVFEVAREISVGLLDLHGTSYEHVAAGWSCIAHGDGDTRMLLAARLERLRTDVGLAPTVVFIGGSIPRSRMRPLPPEQFTRSKSAWVTCHSLVRSLVARTSALQKSFAGVLKTGSARTRGASPFFESLCFCFFTVLQPGGPPEQVYHF